MDKGKKDLAMHSTINDISHCDVCFHQFGSEESCPRMLYCGHTFCQSCLQSLIYYDKSVCPTCRNHFDFRSADDIPINLSVKILSETAHQTKEDGRKLTRKDFEANTFYVTKGNNEEKRYAKVKLNNDQISFEDWKDEIEEGSSCIDFFNFINSKTSVIDTHNFIEEHKAELHNPKLPIEKIKFSKIKVKRGEVFFNCFKTSDESDFLLEFGSLLKTLECSSVVPAEAFLKIQRSAGGEFVIATDGGSPRALNFLLLASGIMDDSYQRIQFLTGSVFVKGGYKKKCNLFPVVVEGIQDGGIYKRENFKRGDVQGYNANYPNNLSSFIVLKEDSSYPSTTSFGTVKRGMEVVDQINDESSVIECGLIFELS